MKPKAIILIIIDTLRSDHLSCYGYRRHTSRNLDEFAKEAVLYKYAFSPSSYTVPAHAAIFTGKYPGNNSLWFQQRVGSLNRNIDITLAEILKSEGYKTAAFVSSLMMRKDWGLCAGFDLYDDRMTSSEANRPTELIRNGTETNEEVFKWLKEVRTSPFFLFIHYFDVHGAYVNQKPYDSIFKAEQYGEKPLLLDSVRNAKEGGIPDYQLLKVVKNEIGEVVNYEKDARYYFAQYDGGIRYCDDIIGVLLDRLKDSGIYDESLIVITADHGEAMGENNVFFFHGLTVSFDQIRVPLLIKSPGRKANKDKVVDEPVSTIDILPTIIASCGIDYSPFEIEGINVFNKKSKSRFILSENQWQRALIKGDYIFLNGKKNIYSNYIYYFDSRRLCSETELYNYFIDPKCKDNLIGKTSKENEFREFSSFFSLHVNPKEQMICEKDSQIILMENLLKQNEQKIREKEHQITSMYASRTWKVGRMITAPWRNLKKIFKKRKESE